MLKAYFIACCILFTQFSFSQSYPEQNPVSQNSYEFGFLYLKLSPGHSLGNEQINSSQDLVDYSELSELMNQNYIIWLEQEFKILAKRNDEMARVYRVSINPNVEPSEMINILEKLNYVTYAERIPQYSISLTPNDPDYSNTNKRWHLDQIAASNAWNSSTGCSTIRIAIVDDAVLTSHPDLQANIYTNSAEIPNNGIDDDGNQYVDDVNGYDVADNDNDPNPPSSATTSVFTHGTHVAGIAGAVSNNGIGIASIGFNSSIVPIKTANDNSNDPTILSNPMLGVEYAISLGVDVINMSWGTYAYSATHQTVMSLAYSDGIVCVASAGNDFLNSVAYPAGYDNVISVGATDPNNEITPFSNYSTYNHVYAPGLNIWSTLAGNSSSYGFQSGTSMASPLVAGLAALMICNNSNLTPYDVKACLRSSADVHYSSISSQNLFIINAENALQCLPPSIYTCEPYNCNLIKNGDFETPANSSITDYGTASGVANEFLCSWETYAGTSDVFPNVPNGNDQFVSGYSYRPYPHLTPYIEGFVSNKMELIPGYTYKLEFDYAIAQLQSTSNPINPELDSLIVGLVDNQYLIPPSSGVNIDTTRLIANANIPVDYVTNNWLDIGNNQPSNYNHLELNFVAPNDTSRQRLFMHPAEWDTLSKMHLTVDNVSVRPVIQFTASASNIYIGPGDCVTLTATGQATSYVWEPLSLFTSPVGSSQLVCLDSTTTFFVTAYDSVVNCSTTDSITVYVEKLGLNSLNKRSLEVFPNPASQSVSAKFPMQLPRAEVKILNTAGQIVIKQSAKNTSEMTVDIEGLSPGVYILKLNDLWPTKLIKE